MQGELLSLLIRNTIASWVVNAEFAAPVLVYAYALSQRSRHPQLTRLLPLSMVLLLLAGLTRQIHEQFLLPFYLVGAGGALLVELASYAQIVYAAFATLGYAILVWAVYYRRYSGRADDPFGAPIYRG